MHWMPFDIMGLEERNGCCDQHEERYCHEDPKDDKEWQVFAHFLDCDLVVLVTTGFRG